jgi:replicative DNA helicase
MDEKALNTGGGLSGITTASTGVNARPAASSFSDLPDPRRAPGMGKTVACHQHRLQLRASARPRHEDGIAPEKSAGAGVAFFSLEMSPTSWPLVSCRAIRDQLGKPAHGQDQPAGFPQPRPRAAELESLPLYIDDTPGLTIAALRTRARRLKRQKGIGFIVVDYLQLLQGTGKEQQREPSHGNLGDFARAEDAGEGAERAGLALSQLSRAVEQREDKRPQLSDLRESGSIEQDADIVLFVYREEYYVAAHEPKRPMDGDDAKTLEAHEQWARDMERVYGLSELIIAKQRHGATGKVKLRFEAKITRFSDYIEEGYIPEMRG